jgi:hypothetical protein
MSDGEVPRTSAMLSKPETVLSLGNIFRDVHLEVQQIADGIGVLVRFILCSAGAPGFG